MADYNYKGLTAYIKIQEDSIEKLSVLAEAVEGIARDIDPVEFDQEKYQNVVESEDYQYLWNNDAHCYPQDWELPENTPHHYSRPSVDTTNIKGIPMFKVYVPVVSKRDDLVNHFTEKALYSVLLALFGNNIACIKTKEQIEYGEFANGEEKVLLSVTR